ncbi:hypothetical protein HDF19_21170 [Mucilaginibacter sp. E4BP6]|jgi:hypothetical protein|uniref:hypothetical protein n=1 Tax=Mucilaginibacter sp. E4BP6 TaxID=2723089 RepID=UPI0015C90078|nr:hypothetical protein [Mucilaginibacter sp. E4BP6]NYE67849.1 hypothetical protein [Mucilaginibacter sp. E4BP6]
MEFTQSEKRNITPEKAVQILQKKGIKIELEDAKNLLDFMYFLAKLIVEQNFKK